MPDIESSVLYEGNHKDYKPNNSWKLLSFGLMCLIFGFLGGGIYQKILDIYSTTVSTQNQSPIVHNPIYNIPVNDDFVSAPGDIPRKKRKNEDMCSKRRCCKRRDEIKPGDLPSGLKCNILNDENCGLNDKYCIWDCNPSLNQGNGKRGKFRRHFRRISPMDGDWEEPYAHPGRGKFESLEECLENGQFIGRDDCGVEYDEEMDADKLRDFCLHHASHQNSKAFGENDDDDDDGNPHEETDSRRRLDVLGGDGRSKVTSTSYPWRAVLYLSIKQPNGASTRCTATMISPYWAITSAHCVYGSGDWYSTWTLYKNVFSCSDRTSANKYNVDYAVTFNAWINSASWDYDIAWLKVSTNAGNSLGWFGFGYNPGLSGTQYFNIISHPADKSDCSKWYQYCPYTEWDGSHQQVTYECDTYGGASGSGVYQFVGTNNRRILAIHSYGACYDSNNVYQGNNVCNTAIRITYSKFYAICGWVERDTADHCPDP